MPSALLRPGPVLLLKALCVLITTCRDNPHLSLAAGPGSSRQRGSLAQAQDALGRCHFRVCVCIYLEYRASVRACGGAFAEWAPFSPVADEAPPLWTQCLYRLISLPTNLSFPIHILLFNVSHDFNKGFFLCTPMHVNNMSCNSASYRSITNVLFPILLGSLPISFIYAGPFLCRPVPSRHGFSLQAFLGGHTVAFAFSRSRPGSCRQHRCHSWAVAL